MQYLKCQSCIYRGNICQMVMANAMTTLFNIQYLVNISQTRNTEHKCELKIDFSCENFTPKKKEEETKNAE